MDEKLIAKTNAFREKMQELTEMVHAKNVKCPEPPAVYSKEELCELRELCVYTRDDDYFREGFKVVIGYNIDIPNQLCLRAFVIDKDNPSGEWYMNVFRGLMGDVEEYIKDEKKYPKLLGYLSILHDRIIAND